MDACDIVVYYILHTTYYMMESATFSTDIYTYIYTLNFEIMRTTRILDLI